MTQQNPTTELPLHLRLPAYRIDYQAGRFTNTQSGEIEDTLTGVVLAYREDRVLWPRLSDPNPLPNCVNGSKYGPCVTCRYAQFGRDNTPPECSAELTVLLRTTINGVATVTARRSMVRPLDEYIAMQELLGQELYSQKVTLKLTSGAARQEGEAPFHVLRVVPGEYLDSAQLAREGAVSVQVAKLFREGALE